MADDFLSRWSRAKTVDKSIREQQEGPHTPEAAPSETPDDRPVLPAVGEAAEAADPGPSMEDAQALSVGDDISRFMGVNVAEEVRSFALRKLFAMPHYNIRSDMDVYSEDFFNMPKLTAAEVANLQQSESLCLFKDPPWRKEMLQEEADQRAADAAAGADPEASGQTEPTEESTQETLVSDEQRPDDQSENVSADGALSQSTDGVLSQSTDGALSQSTDGAVPGHAPRAGKEGEPVS